MQGPRASNALQYPAPRTWSCFFPNIPYTYQDRRAILIRELHGFFNSLNGRSYVTKVKGLLNGDYAASIDYEELAHSCKSQDLMVALDLQPAEALSCISAALAEVVFYGDVGLGGSTGPSIPGMINVRLHNHKPSMTTVRQLKPTSIGRLATLRGTVVRACPMRPLVVQMDFACGKCGAVVSSSFPDGRYVLPTKCKGPSCRSKTFAPVSTSAKCVDWQKLRLQELQQDGTDGQGQVPRTLEVEVTKDLVGSCGVGDVVEVLGVVRVIATNHDTGRAPGKGAKQNLFLMYLDGVSVKHVGEGASTRVFSSQTPSLSPLQGPSASRQIPLPFSSFSVKDMQFVLKFTEQYEGAQLRHLVHALCPGIYGHELVKAGILLALFGGVTKGANRNDRVAIRGDIHILLVGDPGLGKSQLLQAAAASSPRGLYICGNTSTSAGLTVSVARDTLTGDYVFEAGALVLADQGTCCVDEFDKMTQEHQALLEAMEQQEISVAKAGLVASLPARTSVIAAANPVGGHYQRGKMLGENLKMSAAMLSRFDLLFVLLDRPDEVLDQCLSEHVMALHSGLIDRATAARQRLLEYQPSQSTLASGLRGAKDQKGPPPLAERLRMPPDQAGAPLPRVLLQKYIAYARTYVHPVLSPEAREVLRSFYMELRAKNGPMDGNPITARQLESLVRLAEARARVDLREQVTVEDCHDVIEIMKETLFERSLGELGLLDFRDNTTAKKGGKNQKAERFLEAARLLARQEGRDTFSTSELFCLANDINLQVKDIKKFIEELNDAGELLMKGSGVYRIRGVNPSTTPGESQFSRAY